MSKKVNDLSQLDKLFCGELKWQELNLKTEKTLEQIYDVVIPKSAQTNDAPKVYKRKKRQNEK